MNSLSAIKNNFGIKETAVTLTAMSGAIIAVFYDMTYLIAVPAIIICSVGLLINIKFAFAALMFLTPLSVTFKLGDSSLSIPDEPILILLAVTGIIHILITPKKNFSFFSHPVSILLIVRILWIFATSFTSSIPEVSFKYTASQFWLMFAIYFVAEELFKGPQSIKLIHSHLAALMIVVLYTFSRQYYYGLHDLHVAGWVVQPFYNDHTAYGAILALFLPVCISMFFLPHKKTSYKILITAVTATISISIVYSYCRAAWISIAGAAAIFAVLKLKIKPWISVSAAFVIITFIMLNFKEVKNNFYFNKQESSNNISEHIKSVTNIKGDASNLERLNRWHCAFKMFNKHPFIGFGAGTYMFEYGKYQSNNDKTIISTNFGTVGNCHSEYFSPLVETGIPGFVIWIAILFFTLRAAYKVYKFCVNKSLKLIVTGCAFGLITYYIHGILNNFLDTDKLSVPFWTFTMIIVSASFHCKNKNHGENISNTID